MPTGRFSCCTISAPIAAPWSWHPSGGHTSELRCCYHGWTYHLDGRLKAAPLLHGYPPHFDPKNPELAMRRVPRVASYRGFVFGSLAEDGPSLEDYLGYMTTSFDDMVDRAPDGELEVAGGVFKHTYNGNWKLYLENLCDAAHPLFTHQSSIDAAQQQSDDVHSDGSGEIAIRQMRQNGAPYSFWESECRHLDLSQRPQLPRRLSRRCQARSPRSNDPMFRDYIAAMEAKQGKEQTRRILEVRRWNSNVYPNLSFMSQFQQLRVVHPVSVNETVVHTYCFRLRGAPARMFENTISFANIVNGTGSLVLTDDLEIYNRIGLGLSSAGAEWLEIGRGYQGDVAGRARRPARQELDQRGLHPQHVRRLARITWRRTPATRAGIAAGDAFDRRRRRCGHDACPAAPAASDRASGAHAEPLERRRMRAVSDARGAPARRGPLRRVAGACSRPTPGTGCRRSRARPVRARPSR